MGQSRQLFLLQGGPLEFVYYLACLSSFRQINPGVSVCAYLETEDAESTALLVDRSRVVDEHEIIPQSMHWRHQGARLDHGNALQLRSRPAYAWVSQKERGAAIADWFRPAHTSSFKPDKSFEFRTTPNEDESVEMWAATRPVVLTPTTAGSEWNAHLDHIAANSCSYNLPIVVFGNSSNLQKCGPSLLDQRLRKDDLLASLKIADLARLSIGPLSIYSLYRMTRGKPSIILAPEDGLSRQGDSLQESITELLLASESILLDNVSDTSPDDLLGLVVNRFSDEDPSSRRQDDRCSSQRIVSRTDGTLRVPSGPGIGDVIMFTPLAKQLALEVGRPITLITSTQSHKVFTESIDPFPFWKANPFVGKIVDGVAKHGLDFSRNLRGVFSRVPITGHTIMVLLRIQWVEHKRGACRSGGES